MAKMGKNDFLNKLGHSEESFIRKLAKDMEWQFFLPINLEQSKVELIDTLFAIYFKDTTKVHSNSFRKPDHLYTFDFKIHISCPITEASFYRLPYFLIVDKFGFNTWFSRKDAKDYVKKVFEFLEIYADAKGIIVYRTFQMLRKLSVKGRPYYITKDNNKKLKILPISSDCKNGKDVFSG